MSWLDMKFIGFCFVERSGILWKIRDVKALKVFGQCSGLRQVVWKKYSLEVFPANCPWNYRVAKGRDVKKTSFFQGQAVKLQGVCFICTLDLGKWSNLTILKNRLKPPGRKLPKVEVFVVQDFSEKSIHSQLMSWLLMIEITCRTVDGR